MVLIGFGVIAVFQYAGVGHIFQIGTDFPFHEPGKWITPAENAHQFTDDDINGVPLPGMCLLMGQYFVELLFRMRGRVDKNPVEKEKGPSALGSRCILVLPICILRHRHVRRMMPASCMMRRIISNATIPQ